MSASTPIARLVETMLEDGVEHRAVVRAVEAAEDSRRSKPVPASRGTRLSAGWKPSAPQTAYAEALHMTPDRIALEAERFRNYWTAKAGAGATKRDWDATWRNWILKAMEDCHVPANRRGAAFVAGYRATGADAVLAGMDRLARRLAQTRDAAGQGREISASGNAAEDHDAD